MPPPLDPQHPPPASALPERPRGRVWPRPHDPAAFWVSVVLFPALIAGLAISTFDGGWYDLFSPWVLVAGLGPLATTALVGRVAGLSLQRTVTLTGYAYLTTFAFIGLVVVVVTYALVAGCTDAEFGCGFS